MQKLIPAFLFLIAVPAAPGQSRPDLFVCEGCEAIHETEFENLSWETVVAGPDEPGERLIISGTVVFPDGQTPAEGVVVYVYHTNAEGVYPTRGGERGWARRHGYLRGWMKTGSDGKYRFTSIRPATYPSRTEPAHIHFTVKEPDRQEYWIDSIRFEGDPLLTEERIREFENRGGSGIIQLSRRDDGTWIGDRTIVLER